MKREQAIELLRGGQEGVLEWNARCRRGEAIPDLAHVNLSRCDLIGVDLHGAHLSGSFLGGSHLDCANLSQADLERADMPACPLYEANLRRANLREANLRGANVSCADITDADFRGANLCDVDLSSAMLCVTDLDDIRSSMCRIEGLPLHEDVRDILLELMQKLDILEVTTSKGKQVLTNSINRLITALLRTPRDADQVRRLLAVIRDVAPPLVEDLAAHVLMFGGR